MAYLYHVTYYGRLGAIEDEGLRPGRGRGIGSAIYDTHRRGAIFLTEGDGVFFWGARAEEWANNRSDDVYGDELAPVLLRVKDRVLRSCELDELGTRDARADAYRCESAIDPDDLEVWVGVDGRGRWRPIDEWNKIPYDDAFEVEDYDGEEIRWLKPGGSGSPSALIPEVD